MSLFLYYTFGKLKGLSIGAIGNYIEIELEVGIIVIQMMLTTGNINNRREVPIAGYTNYRFER
jgi:hypothetical protein